MAGERFEWALGRMRLGERVRRAEWKPDVWLRIDDSTGPPIMNLERPRGTNYGGWIPDSRDLHATDWELYSEIDLSGAIF